MDIAQLAYEVDSSGLVQGNRALDENVKAAERASDAAAELEDRYRRIAQEGIAYAESMRTANVSERAAAEAQRESASALNSRAMLMARSGTEAERMAARVERLQASEARAAAATEASARATALQELNLKKLLGQIDPTIAKLDRLADMERRLEKARDLGAINPQVFDQYQAKLDATRAATLNVGAASDTMTQSLGSLNLQSVETQQSVAALARALATGQWGQAQASITSLTARTGVMSAAFSAGGLAIGAAGVAVGGFTLMAAKGYLEARRLEDAIIATGNAAGVTSGQVMDLRNEIGRSTGDYAGAGEALQQLILSGKAGGEMLEAMGRSAANAAHLTGQSMSSVAGDITALADGGEDALRRLEERYNFLTAATDTHIAALRKQYGDIVANTEAAKEFDRVMAERAETSREAAGKIERAWDGITRAIGGALQELKDFGRTDLERQITEAERALNRAGGPRGAPGEAAVLQSILDDLRERKRLLDANTSAAALADAAVQKAMEASRRRAGEAAGDQKKANEEHERRLAQMDREYARQRELNEVQAIFNRLAADDPRQFDGSRERMLAAVNRRYDEMAAKAQAVAERRSEEAAAVDRLLAKFAGQEAAMERQIALYGDTSRAAALAYDIQVSGLREHDAALASSLTRMAERLDMLNKADKAVRDVLGYADEVDKMMAEERAFDDRLGRMSEYARQAARNMQSHFADFLFDPFAEGTRGMVEGFSDALRRMAAEAAASAIFDAVGNWAASYTGQGAGWINAVGSVMKGGDREYGGSVYAGWAHRVGERNKPELLTTPNGQYLIPGENGRVDPVRAAPVVAGAGASAPSRPVVNIEIINHTGETVRREETRAPDGRMLERIIIGTVNRGFGSGDFDGAMRGLYGMERRGGRSG